MVEYRSSFSPIIREMLDFSCGIFDAEGRHGRALREIPAQLGLMQSSLQQGLAKHHPDGLRPRRRDADQPPVHGRHAHARPAGVQPVYAGGRLVGYAGSIAHHIDIGGRVPGTESAENTELFQEGLIFPAIMLVERGRRVRRALAGHRGERARPLRDARRPRRADLGACRRGEQRLLELCERYGVGHAVRRHRRPARADLAARARRVRLLAAHAVEASRLHGRRRRRSATCR